MRDAGKKNVLGVGIDAVDYDAAVERIIGAAREKRALTVSALAVHGVMTAVTDAFHRHRVNSFDLVAPDGQPVRWALNLLHRAGLSDRVYGPNLTLRVCERAAREGLPVFLYGSRPEVLERLEKNLTETYPALKVAGARPSMFRTTTAEEKEQIAREIRDSGAAIVFVGLGCPRQEVWAYEYRDLLPMPILAVGAAFDFHAGLLPQAPPVMQDHGLEWLFRLVQEPRRLWRRYVYLNPAFVALLALQALGLRRPALSATLPPDAEIRYG
jgi:N-acetylglucosaminyldiphosphoundecaprenol N-acetyl-beta-D-mannosaminyltransferase